MPKLEDWAKGLLLEVQEYLRMIAATARALVSRPYYTRDIVEQFEVIGIGSLTVVLLTGLMVAGRVGSGIAAELGSMMVTEQISALRALGTDPIRKLVLPRILAGVIMVPVLTVIATGVGMVGAWIITITQLKVASSVYWNSVVAGLYIEDVWMGLLKPFFLGFAIVSIGCHVGLRTSGGTQGVGRATTNAVVASSVAVIAVDYFVTQVLILLMY